MSFRLDEESARHDVELGRCSGFPECCIAHYIFVWLPALNKGTWRYTKNGPIIGLGSPYVRAHRRAMDLIQAEVGDVWYVPCPACMLRRSFVKVRRCSPERCGHPRM